MNDLPVGALTAVLCRALGERVAIDHVERLKGGYSRSMWRFTATAGPAPPRRMVLCADSSAGVVDATASLDRVREFGLLRALHECGVPVPGVVCADEGRDELGRPTS